MLQVQIERLPFDVAVVQRGDRGHERLGGQILGRGGVAAPSGEVAVDVGERVVVQLEERRRVGHDHFIVRRRHFSVTRVAALCS